MFSRIHVEGYRLLDDFTADLATLNVVIGANATGKSTLLECLGLLSRLMNDNRPPNQLLNVSQCLNVNRRERRIRMEVTFQKPADSSVWSAIPLDPNREYTYLVEFATDAIGRTAPSYECLRYVDVNGPQEPSMLLEATPDRSLLFDPRTKRMERFDEGEALSPRPIPEQGSLRRMQDAERRLLLSRMYFTYEYPQLSWIRYILGGTTPYHVFDVSPRSRLKTQPFDIAPVTTLDSYGDNLGTVLHEILTRSSHPDYANTIREFMRLAYPTFEGVYADLLPVAGNPQVVVAVREQGVSKAFQLSELSDGMVRFLCLTVALFDPVPRLIAVDEPEVGLHPKLLPLLGDMIKAASASRQIIVTTHSPELLDRFDLDDIAVMTRTGNSANWYRPGDRDTLRTMLEAAVGGGLGDLFRSTELESLG